jgi:hypothetical protein
LRELVIDLASIGVALLLGPARGIAGTTGKNNRTGKSKA